MCVGTPRITSRYFKLLNSGHRSASDTIVKKKEKHRHLIRLSYPLFSSLPTHTHTHTHTHTRARARAVLRLEFDVTFRVLTTTLHPTSLSFPFNYHFLRYVLYAIPSIFKIQASSVLPFPEVLTPPLSLPACVSLFARLENVLLAVE